MEQIINHLTNYTLSYQFVRKFILYSKNCNTLSSVALKDDANRTYFNCDQYTEADTDRGGT